MPIAMPKQTLFRSITEPRSGRTGQQYASFIAIDWRNDKIEEISTDPGATTSYFESEGNSLPYEVSPAFFRAELLSKYKADRDKYTIHEATRFITCRGAWELKSYDINEAGQVHAYICDLRNLPYQEQLHWKSQNEKPKDTISKRAYENDFEGIWSSHITAVERVLHILQRWIEQRSAWWQIQDEALLLRVNTPVSDSKDEWAQAFLNISKTVIENFRIKPIRAVLHQEKITFDNSEGTLSLLEKTIATLDRSDSQSTKLKGLREAQRIRSLVQAHSGSREADEIAKRALTEHGTYRKHFEQVCRQIAEELEEIERAFATRP